MTSEELKQYRERLNLNQKQMARFIGVPGRTWINWEQGTRKMPPVAQSYINFLLLVETLNPGIIAVKMQEARG